MDSIELKFNKTDIKRVAEFVDGAEKVVITAHMSPDGDAVGSSMGLAHVLQTMGKQVSVIYPDSPSLSLRFLTKGIGYTAFCEQPEFSKQLFEDCDLIFCLDYNAPKRVDEMAPTLLAAKAKKVMIDHHLDPEEFCDIAISSPSTSSTCMLLFKVICALELVDAIDEDAATCILAGMMTDTGDFSYNNANNPEIYHIVANLIELGAKRLELVKKLFDTFTADCLRLNAYAIAYKMMVWEDKGAALITLTREELNEYNYKPGYCEGLVNKPLAIEAVKYVYFLREETKYIKVSMRSKDNFPCNQICQEYFNGGGHLNAAGGEFHGSMDDAVALIESLIEPNYEKYLKK